MIAFKIVAVLLLLTPFWLVLLLGGWKDFLLMVAAIGIVVIPMGARFALLIWSDREPR